MDNKEYVEINKENTKDKYYTVGEFELDVYAVENVRVILRCSKDRKVLRYPHKKPASGHLSIGSFINRVKESINSEADVALLYYGEGFIKMVEESDLDSDLSTIRVHRQVYRHDESIHHENGSNHYKQHTTRYHK